MGIIKEELVNTNLPSGYHLEIELNEDGSVDIHLDYFRVSMEKRRFIELARIVLKARDNLESIKS